MGKRIIVQARGKGSSTYRVKRSAFRYRLWYPRTLIGNGTVVSLLNSPAHSAPLAKIMPKQGKAFYVPACKGMAQGDTIAFHPEKHEQGAIMKLTNIPVKTHVYNIEAKPGDGGKLIKGGGNFAIVSRVVGKDIYVTLPSKKERKCNPECRAMIGEAAGSGRLEKPIVKAGKKFYMKKSKSKLWPRTSALKMNAIDHPFGSGRGKNPKSKIAKRNAPPGAKVGLLRPRRTGKRK